VELAGNEVDSATNPWAFGACRFHEKAVLLVPDYGENIAFFCVVKGFVFAGNIDNYVH
jgi:hypothetical protein